MKNRVIDKISNSYIYVVMLMLYVILTLFVSILVTNVSNKEINIVLNGKKLELNDGVIEQEETRYITLEDIELNFPNHTFYDKISRTLIITTWDEKIKIKKGDEGTLDLNNETIYALDMLSEKLGYAYVEDTKTNNIHMYEYSEDKIAVNKDRTEVYSINNNTVIGMVNKQDKLEVILNESAFKSVKEDKYITVKINNEYIARIRKDSTDFVKREKDETKQAEEKVVFVSVESKLSNNTNLSKVTALAIEALELTAANKVEELKYTLSNISNKDIYAVINNGYKQTGFDTNIITDLVNSDKNKEKVANDMLNYVIKNNYQGLVIDFKKFKTSDKDLLEQYIKELAVLMHSNNKKLIVKMMSKSAYDISDIKDFVDYVIVQAYASRTTSSKMSGSHSTVGYVEKTLNEFLIENISAEKLILEIPTYSILWTERGGTIINAENYSMQAVKEYIKENKITSIYNEASGQNVINYTKGIVTYKMWLEDETSIKAKVEIAKKLNLIGISIYKSGEETKNIYDIINLEVE